ncbi:dihydrolipoyl dehydrogenase [Buchnera aphidicola (Mollitrichosiphum nigrofasciatum)]|uniref:dihydrolipoyl dehydrogenase n=1 Tax=Buchnera aphidicola TaxID=9 RepID=UPI0031B84393
MKDHVITTKVVVIGAGPAGYSAAFRCSDLGLNTILIERYNKLGGVCLNVGCIPSKTLLHIAKIFKDTRELYKKGIFNSFPKLNVDSLHNWKNSVVNKISSGLQNIAKFRNVKIIYGIGSFIDHNTISVVNQNSKILIKFEYCIIAIGSKSVDLPLKISGLWNSTQALNFPKIPSNLLIIGGGVIGLELATLYSSFGSTVDVVDNSKKLLSMVDNDIMKIFKKNIENEFNLLRAAHVSCIKKDNCRYIVTIVNQNGLKSKKKYDNIIVCIGRYPDTKLLKIDSIGLKLNDKGFIKVNKQMKTNINNIYAIGDIVGEPMLAHKAIHQAHIAAEVISGKNHFFEPQVIPSIAYTDPEVAWVGINEEQAIIKKINYKAVSFPWSASGRAIAVNSAFGLTKLIFNRDTCKIIGGSIIGSNAGELLSEISLAIEMGCDAEDIALTIHAHPTLYETIGLTAEIFQGTVTDIINVK